MSLQVPDAKLLDRNLPCALCKESDGPRQLSHIIPSFVFKHASVRAPTGHLRNSFTPNRRVQDGPKDYVLCRECEQRFAVWERSFADTFRRFYENPSAPFRYNHADAMCALSILWRVLHNARAHPELNHLTFGDDYSRTDAAFEAWSKALLLDTHPGNFRVYWLFFDRIVSGTGIGEGINTFIFHATDFDLMANSKESFAYAHLPGLYLFGMTETHAPSEWKHMRVGFNGGLQAHQNRSVPGFIGSIIREKMAASRKAKAEISDGQQQKIAEAALKDPEKLWNSPLTRSIFADKNLKFE